MLLFSVTQIYEKCDQYEHTAISDLIFKIGKQKLRHKCTYAIFFSNEGIRNQETQIIAHLPRLTALPHAIKRMRN